MQSPYRHTEKKTFTPGRPSAAEARATLDFVAESRKTLAPYVRSPWWLYPLQGLGSAAAVIGLAFATTRPEWSSALVAAAGLFVLTVAMGPVMDARLERAVRTGV